MSKNIPETSEFGIRGLSEPFVISNESEKPPKRMANINFGISDREINVLFQYILKNHTKAVKDSKTNMQKFHSGALVFRENGKIKYVPEHFTLKDLSQFLLACGRLPSSKNLKTFSRKDSDMGLTHERS